MGNFLSPLSSLLSPLFSLYAMARSAEDVQEREGENGAEEVQRLSKSLEDGWRREKGRKREEESGGRR